MKIIIFSVFCLVLWASHEALTSLKQPENSFVCLDGIRTYRFPSPDDKWECD